MEDGIPVKISPKKSKVLVFESNGETVFTSNDITIDNPGGDYVSGSFERAVDEFFNVYFRQSFLASSGLKSYINNPILYKQNIKKGSKSGKAVGVNTGFKWIANAHMGVE
jgi:hypothetical protein